MTASKTPANFVIRPMRGEDMVCTQALHAAYLRELYAEDYTELHIETSLHGRHPIPTSLF